MDNHGWQYLSVIEMYWCGPVSCIKTGTHSADFVHCSEMKKYTKLSEMKINGGLGYLFWECNVIDRCTRLTTNIPWSQTNIQRHYKPTNRCYQRHYFPATRWIITKICIFRILKLMHGKLGQRCFLILDGLHYWYKLITYSVCTCNTLACRQTLSWGNQINTQFRSTFMADPTELLKCHLEKCYHLIFY